MRRFQLNRCNATTRKGTQCQGEADASGFCKVHNKTGYVYTSHRVSKNGKGKNKDRRCQICGMVLVAIPEAKKLRAIGRCKKHIGVKLPAKPINCRQCGKPIKPDNDQGICINCAVDNALESGTDRKVAYYRYLRTADWREKAEECKRRFLYRCALCNSTDNLDAHHRTYKNLFNEQPEDLICLCRRCHEKHHDVMEEK